MCTTPRTRKRLNNGYESTSAMRAITVSKPESLSIGNIGFDGQFTVKQLSNDLPLPKLKQLNVGIVTSEDIWDLMKPAILNSIQNKYSRAQRVVPARLIRRFGAAIQWSRSYRATTSCRKEYRLGEWAQCASGPKHKSWWLFPSRRNSFDQCCCRLLRR